ncbi:hypothetical protein [Arsenicicoccus dermatophilus]|uniref:hypothetical protein n=1 Tax=Arsenicicoccus dermatophilus TaxID=1076331 RepID=UPI001F4C62C0|nr:hypothetical protein [Arsenicicoccus dermatophilus]MCH8614437.1 hypothetical protein [Arsenicicoccus dermatophilus]
MSDFRRGAKVRFTRDLRESGLIPGRVVVMKGMTGTVEGTAGWLHPDVYVAVDGISRRVKVSRFDLEVLPPRTGDIITARGW